MKYLAFFIAFCYVMPQTTKAQEISNELLKDLSFYSDVMINAVDANHRKRAGVEFNGLFKEYLKLKEKPTKEVFPFISVLESPDSTFTLISWPVELEEKKYDFKGYVISSEHEIYELNRTDSLDVELAYTSSTAEDWYGCVYYKIQKLSKNQYLIFGFDLSTQYDNHQLIDVLSFNNGSLVFGAPIFEDKKALGTYNNRLIISYSSDASVTLNYNENLGMIIQDHLEPRMGLQAGQGATNIPDGTYEGYVWNEGKWKYKEKIFNHIYEEAPRPNPVFNDGGKRDQNPLGKD